MAIMNHQIADGLQCNNKTTTIKFEYMGQIKTLKEWSDIYNINIHTLYYRYKKNWNIKKMLNEPIKTENYKGVRKDITDNMIMDLLNDNKSIEEISELLSYSKNMIYRRLNRINKLKEMELNERK